MTVEARQRHTPKPKPLSLLCMRCDQRFSWPTITRECKGCTRASERLYGAAHPAWEISGW